MNERQRVRPPGGRRVRPSGRATLALLVLAGLVVGCGDGESILDAGDVAPATTSAPPTTAVGQTTVPGATTIAPTTTAAVLDELPDCPVEALDEAAGQVQITFWHGMGGGAATATIEQLVGDYNAGQSKVHVDLIGQGSYLENLTKYTDASRDSRPDVIQLPEYVVQSIVDLGATVPVGKCVDAAGYDTSPILPNAIESYSTGGVHWSMPFNISNPVLYYNKKVFAAAGLDPERPPLTLDDVETYSRQIVDSGAATYGIALESGFDSGGGWFLEQWFAKLGRFYVDNDNGRRAKATQALYNDATGAELMGALKGLLDEGLAVNVGDNAGVYDNLLKLADGQQPAAMTIGTSAFLGSVLEILAGGQFPALGLDDVGIGPMPGPGAPGVLVGGASLWLTDSGDPARVAASWDFVEYMIAAQQQSTWAAATGYVPIRPDAEELDPLAAKLVADPRFAVAGQQLEDAADVPTFAGPIAGPLREMRLVAAQGVARIFDGADIPTTLDGMVGEANALMAEYNARNPG